jgi:isoleucyl-tRNA synthetase
VDFVISSADGSKVFVADTTNNVIRVISAATGNVTTLAGGGSAVIEKDDVLIRTTAKEGWAAAEGPQAVVVVASALTPELIAEGLVREVVHAVQSQRKTLDLEFTDRIALGFETDSAELRAALEQHLDYVAGETLATSASFSPLPGGTSESLDIDGHPLTIHLKK